MSTEFGSDDAAAGPASAKRNALIVRVVQPLYSLPGYEERANSYWDAARDQISRQEATLGAVRKVFAEGVAGHGLDGMLVAQRANPGLHRFLKALADDGATLAPFEDAELFQEVVEWSQCVGTEPRSESVRKVVIEHYHSALEARNAHLSAVLEAGIEPGETVVVLAHSDGLPLPSDVERYLISPPELDQLDRWLREQIAQAQREMAEAAQAAAAAETPGATGGGDDDSDAQSGGRLWTPP